MSSIVCLVGFLSIQITQSSIVDRTSVNVTFSKYEVQAGPGVPITNNRKSCQLKFGIRYAISVLL